MTGKVHAASKYTLDSVCAYFSTFSLDAKQEEKNIETKERKEGCKELGHRVRVREKRVGRDEFILY